MNNKKVLIGLSVALLIAAIVYRQKIADFVKEKITGGGVDDEVDFNSLPKVDRSKLLKIGVSGVEVKELQGRLLTAGAVLPNSGVDGIFGQETEKALQAVLGVKQTTLEEYDNYLNSVVFA